MHSHQILTFLIPPTLALSLPSTPAPRAIAQTCGLYKYAQSPNNPPACWAWYASTSPASDYCGASTLSTVSTATSSSTSWLDSCTSLHATEQSAPRDFFLADYATNTFNTLLSSGNCAFEVQPATPPSSDQVYIGGTDVVDVLGSAIDASRTAGGKVGVEGSMTCSPGVVRWRIVPV